MSSPALLAIGDFSRATQLSVKMLRHYHQIGPIEPVDVDRATGDRRYSTDQISTAQIIRRFRALEMPLDEIRTVMSTTDIHRRNELINPQQRIDPEVGPGVRHTPASNCDTSPPPPTGCRSIRYWRVSSPRSPKAAGHVRRHLPHTRVAMVKFSAQFATSRHSPDRSDTETCSLHTHFRTTTVFGEADAASARPAHSTKWRIN
jgi:DNA-binding transcriptional MerR regulator